MLSCINYKNLPLKCQNVSKRFIMKLIKTKAIFLAAGLIALPLSGCSQNAAENSNNDTTLTGNPKENPAAFTFKKDPVTVNAFKLDTYISISAYEDIDESYLYDTLELFHLFYKNIFFVYQEKIKKNLYHLYYIHLMKIPRFVKRSLRIFYYRRI